MNFLLHRKIAICMLFIALTGLGYVSYKQLPVELLPNAELPMLFVQVTSTQDMDPSYVESEVVIPLEGAIGTIGGVEQIESQIDQNTEISKEFSLWNSSGSKYTRGDMFVIPINDSILYVEPVYLESSTDTSLPEVKRVIVAYGDRIAYEPTLAEALIQLFSLDEDYTPNGIPPETPSDTEDPGQTDTGSGGRAYIS